MLVGEPGSAGVGGGGAASGFVSAGAAGVGGWSSAAGAVGLGAGRGAFLRFTVFLLTSSFLLGQHFHRPIDYRRLRIRL